MGDADYIKEAFVKNGIEIFFHGINVKPGRPTMMGKMGKCFVMAMPGNPLTTMINTFLLSVPLLFKMQGNNTYNYPFVYAKNIKPFKTNHKRTNIVLGNFKEGCFHVTRDNNYGSGMLTPILESNALCILSVGKNGVCEDEIIKIILFDTPPLSKSNNNIN
jgi:molybdopterin molybdotransferase